MPRRPRTDNLTVIRTDDQEDSTIIKVGTLITDPAQWTVGLGKVKWSTTDVVPDYLSNKLFSEDIIITKETDLAGGESGLLTIPDIGKVAINADDTIRGTLATKLTGTTDRIDIAIEDTIDGKVMHLDVGPNIFDKTIDTFNDVPAPTEAYNFNHQRLSFLGAPLNDQDATTKQWVLDQVATKDQFTELNDVPHSYTDQEHKHVRVNATEDALEFYTFGSEDEIFQENTKLKFKTNNTFITVQAGDGIVLDVTSEDALRNTAATSISNIAGESVYNTALTGDISNVSTEGDISNTANVNIVNVSTAGDINNTANVDITNITTIGKISNTAKTDVDLTAETGAVNIDATVGAVNIDAGTNINLNQSTKLAADKTLQFNLGVAVNEFSNDGTLAGDSDLAIPTEKATKKYVDNQNAQRNVPSVGTISDLKAIDTTDLYDRITGLVEAKGLYRFDKESSSTEDLDLIVAPTTGPGRWFRLTAEDNQHNLSDKIQGGSTNERYHLTQAEHTVATQTATSSRNGVLSSSDWSAFDAKADNFLELDDAPASYATGSEYNVVRVNAGKTGVEFFKQFNETIVAGTDGQTVFTFTDIGRYPLVFIDGVQTDNFTWDTINQITLMSGVNEGTKVTARG